MGWEACTLGWEDISVQAIHGLDARVIECPGVKRYTIQGGGGMVSVRLESLKKPDGHSKLRSRV